LGKSKYVLIKLINA